MRSKTTANKDRVVGFRVSKPLDQEVRSIAELSDESYSVTLRRLVRLGIQAERNLQRTANSNTAA